MIRIRIGMPAGTTALFFLQMISILSFSVLYSSLILYTTKELKLNDLEASSLTGAFLALNYFLHLISGAIGGRYLSFRSLFSISMFLQIIGCCIISIPKISFLLWGLAPFLAGCGLNVSCINCLLTQLFSSDDKRREAAFLWNYGGQNLGIFLGFLLAGYFDLQNAYRELFIISALGNILALVVTFYNWNTLRDLQTLFSAQSKEQKQISRITGFILIVTLIIIIHYLLQHISFCDDLIIAVTLLVFGLIFTLAIKDQSKPQRNKMFAYCILAIATIICWTLILMGPIGLNLFTERNVTLSLFGTRIAPQWVQNINNIATFLAAPIFSRLFSYLRKRGLKLTIPCQFSIGLILIGIAYIILPIGIAFANNQGYSNVNWVICSFMLQAIGDVFVSPVGYAMVGQLAPRQLRGLMTGAWLMFGGITGIFADYFSQMAMSTSSVTNPLFTNMGYSHTFYLVGITAILAGFVLYSIIPWVNNLIGGESSEIYPQQEELLKQN